MNIITKNTLKLDESYLLFIGYDYSQSGFEIGTFNMSGYFECQSRTLPLEVDQVKLIYELPDDSV